MDCKRCPNGFWNNETRDWTCVLGPEEYFKCPNKADVKENTNG